MVTVLLAVYNGEKYLKEQIDSLLNQTFNDIRIIIRDDGSTDNSLDIINDYCKKYPLIISSLTGKPTGSAVGNFAELLYNCDDDYIMFCDQDDVWLPQKIEKTISVMKKTEGADKNTPVLVHSDLIVADQNLKTVSQSFFAFQRLDPENISLSGLLVQNCVTGCTVMINRALKEKCGKIPNDCIMHDWWLAITAQLFGKIACVREPLMLYRQHSDNQVGAKASYGIALIKRKLSTLNEVRKNYNATYAQAQAVLRHYAGSLAEKERNLLEIYVSIPSKNKFKKIRIMQKYGFKKGTALRVIGQYILI